MNESYTGLTRYTWPVGTNVKMMYVPWDATYRDVPVFNSITERDAWFAKDHCGTEWSNGEFSYLRQDEPITVPVAFSTAYGCNYVVVTNPRQPVETEGPLRTLFYFITGCEYAAPKSSVLTLQLDVMMTFQHAVQLGNMFVESGHIGVSNAAIPEAAEDLTGEKLRTYFTVPENLDIGAEYTSVQRAWYPMNESENLELGRVIVVSSINLAAHPGTIDKPAMNVADGQSADGLPSGCNVYSMRTKVFKEFMTKMQKFSWAAQGIVSISSFPARLLSAGPEVELFGDTGVMMNFIGETDSMTQDTMPYVETDNVFQKLAIGIPNLQHDYKKFFTYPYSVIELTAFTGNSIFLKPELIRGNKLSIYAIGCALAPFSRVAIFAKNYGYPDYGVPPSNDWKYVRMGQDGLEQGTIPPGDFLDSALWLGDFPQFSIVNNNYITYMASTANTRAFSYQSAGWQNTKASEGADLARQQAVMGLQNSQANYNATPQGLGANLLNSITAHPSLNPQLGPNYAHGGLLDNLNQLGWLGTQTATNNLTGRTQQQNDQNLGYYNADTNRQYAGFAASGDYRNTIAGIEATVQDAALQPPSVSGQLGGQGFAWKNGLVGFAVNFKMVGGAQARSVIELWQRYGYRVHRFINLSGKTLKDLKVMQKFSYWQVQETYITCATANEGDIATIRGVLEKGVTIWDNPDYIGTTTIDDNKPLRNITY